MSVLVDHNEGMNEQSRPLTLEEGISILTTLNALTATESSVAQPLQWGTTVGLRAADWQDHRSYISPVSVSPWGVVHLSRVRRAGETRHWSIMVDRQVIATSENPPVLHCASTYAFNDAAQTLWDKAYDQIELGWQKGRSLSFDSVGVVQ
jgi:hypothetical protein